MTYNIIDVIKDELTGNTDKLTKEEQQVRIKTCESCPDFKKLTRQCGHCGCFMDAKTKYRQSECPENKWPF